MNTINQIERLRKIHKHIKICNTGTPLEFANKLDISESQLYNILNDLRAVGFPISYSRKLKSYKYNEECELELIFSIQLLTAKEKINIAGGTLKNSLTPMQLE